MAEYASIVPGELEIPVLHRYLLGAVGPRPIAFASTMDTEGKPNLSPFSFFNVFSANPPIMIFSPARRVRNNTVKHTLENCRATKEVVINIVNYNIVQQMSLSSTEYPSGVNEFIKSGLTMLASDLVKPFRVAESPVQFECKVVKIEALGREGGAGNLIFAEVLKMHINKAVLDANGQIDQALIDQVARLGGSWYTRAKEGLFEVPKPISTLGIGVDQIPVAIKQSKVLTGNDLGKLGNVERLPDESEIDAFLKNQIEDKAILSSDDLVKIHRRAQEYLNENDTASAWKLLLAKI